MAEVLDRIEITEPADLFRPLHLRFPQGVSEKMFVAFCEANKEMRIERNADGELEIMTPESPSSAGGNVRLGRFFDEWAERDGTGQAFGSSAGFTLANGAMRSPDVSWVSNKQLDKLTKEDWKTFPHLCPEFVLELRSPSDRLGVLQAKMDEYIQNGAKLGWLVDAVNKRVHIYRPGETPEIIENPGVVSGEPTLRGFALDFSRVWKAMRC